MKSKEDALTGSSKVRLIISLLKSRTKRFRIGAERSGITLVASNGASSTETMPLMSVATIEKRRR